MKKMASFLVDHRRIFLCLFLLLAAVSLALAGQVRINYDLTEYLPEDSRMKQGIRRMEQESLSEYPIEITTSSFSMENTMMALASMRSEAEAPAEDATEESPAEPETPAEPEV